MKIYMASRYSRHLELAAYAETLTGMGHEITARWLLGLHEAADGDTSRWGEFAQEDIDDITRCELVLCFTEGSIAPGRSRGGRHFEAGLAQGMGKKLIVIGPRENVFYC